MVPKQAVQIQEDHEERAVRGAGGGPPAPTAVLGLPDLPGNAAPLGLTDGRQQGDAAGTLRRRGLHEHFRTLVPRTPPPPPAPAAASSAAGLDAEDSDDVIAASTTHFWTFGFFSPHVECGDLRL